jgi:hypothetical protein
MKKQIFITGLTRMYDGFVCISGIDVQTGQFIRPVINYPERPGIKKEFLFDGDKLVIKPLVQIELDFLKAKPQCKFHTEDWEINPSIKPKIVAIPSECQKKEILDKHLDQSLNKALYDQNRSLIIIKPQQTPLIDLSSREDRLKTHLTFRDLSGTLHSHIPVTDANWLGIARWLWIKHCGDKKKTENNLKWYLENKDIYLRIGITRKYKGQQWKQISGVFSFPDWLMGNTFVEYNYDFDDQI